MMPPLDLLEVSQRMIAAHPFIGMGAGAVHTMLLICEERVYTNGEVLCKERSHGDEMWFLVAGRARVLKRDIRNDEHLIAMLEAPDLIGPLTLIDNAARSATVAADGVAITRVLDRAVYVRLMTGSTPEGAALRRLLLACLHQQLSRSHTRIRTLGPASAAPAAGLNAAGRSNTAPRGPTIQILEEESYDDLVVELTEEEVNAAVDILSSKG